MLEEIVQLSLMIASCIFAILTVELKDLLHTVLSLAAMAISLGALFWILNAPYVAVFQILVYAGAVVVLFVAAVMLTRRK
ncbi:MAG: NADH-quinone oxidoreductase subunit J [Candidatus Bathyarchaeota archaeon]|jgi:NADH-quinone oxidoreductase subunit J|nr:NADH-quinone oxidoreductase subunit J [Candidatus Bathyarchaeota archaeon]MCX6658900.1 NADH-quinone oxidoreductase subunit J [Candidatus Bathyarchaeota archaeon]